MPNSDKYLRAVGTPSVSAVRTNQPKQYKDRQRQYMAERRSLYDEARDYLATDFVKARVQGLNPDDFYAWTETYIRLSDVSTQSVTAFDSKQYDDFKEILFRSRAIDYIPVGAYVETMGSMWMVVNPGNMSSGVTNAVIARCRAHWSFYDAYGNIKWEPLVIDRRTMLSNRNESPENLVLMEGYFNIKCQKNENTMKLKDNQRIILGAYAYHITGFTDFFEEFTGDDDSAHVINITARREAPEDHDDLVNHIADGLLYRWDARIHGDQDVAVGEQIHVWAAMVINGVEAPPTYGNPQTWTFTSSREDIAAVGNDGYVTGIAEGESRITAHLNENPNLEAGMIVTVTAAGESGIRFVGVIPPRLRQYSTIVLEAVYAENGVDTEDAVEWSFSGPAKSEYTAKVTEDGRHCEITCNSPTTVPLVVKISKDGYNASASIALEGY